MADRPTTEPAAQAVRIPAPPLRPPRISGSAMPGGVHLSTGVYRTAGSLALVATGLSIAAMGVVAMVMTYVFTWAADQVVPLPLIPALLQMVPAGSGLQAAAVQVGLNLLTFLCFLTVMRLSPLSGYHAAEHKVIGAIEHFGEPTLDRARAMPRAHRRCGSNLLAGVLPVLLIAIPLFHYQPVVAGLVTVLGWLFRFQTGYLIQMIFATKEPTDHQLRGGLHAARKLLHQWRQDPYRRVAPLVSIWQRGFPQTFLGLMLGLFAAGEIYKHLHVWLDF